MRFRRTPPLLLGAAVGVGVASHSFQSADGSAVGVVVVVASSPVGVGVVFVIQPDDGQLPQPS